MAISCVRLDLTWDKSFSYGINCEVLSVLAKICMIVAMAWFVEGALDQAALDMCLDNNTSEKNAYVSDEYLLTLSASCSLNSPVHNIYTKPMTTLFRDNLQPSLLKVNHALQFLIPDSHDETESEPKTISLLNVIALIASAEQLTCAAQLFGLVFFFVVFLFVSFKIMEAMIFGKIRQQERDALQERLVMTVLRSLLGLFVLDVEIDDRLTWAAFCAVIVFLQGQATLCRERIDYLRVALRQHRNQNENDYFSDYHKYKWQYRKLMFVLVSILLLNVKLMYDFSGPIVCTTCPSTVMLLVFEVATALVKTLHTLVKDTLDIAIAQADSGSTDNNIFDPEDQVFFCFQVSCEIVVSSINMIHLLCIWILNGISFALVDAVIILNMRSILIELRELVSSLVNHFSSKRKVDLFSKLKVPDDADYKNGFATRSCPICLHAFGSLQVVVMLPCNHFFHSNCMRRWMEVGPSHCCTCPMCRQVVCTLTRD